MRHVLRASAALAVAAAIFAGGYLTRAYAEESPARPELAELAPVPPYLFASETQVGAVFTEAKRNADIQAWSQAVAAHEAEMAALATVASVPSSGPAGGLPARSVPGPGSDFLACTRAHESDTAGGYQAVSPDGRYRGAYQFDQQTWEGVGGTGDPAAASPEEQDARATRLYEMRGNAPWGGRC